MTLREPAPPNSVLPLKPPLATHQPPPPSPLSLLSPLSPSLASESESESEMSDASEKSFRSASSTYLDLGGACVRDEDWPTPVTRDAISRVYDSSSDEEDKGAIIELDAHAGTDSVVEERATALHPTLRSQVLNVLESADDGIYSHWAVAADDALSLEELQLDAQLVETQIEKRTRRRPRFVGDDVVGSADSADEEGVEEVLDGDDLMDIMIDEDAVETADDTDLLIDLPVRERGRRRHRRIETLDDGDVLRALPPTSNGKRGHARIETLEDIDVRNITPPLSNGKRGHARIETLEDIDVPSGIPPLSNGKRGHARIETLEDIEILSGIPPLSNEKRGHRRVETLEDIEIPNGIPPLSNGKRGHGRIETLEDIDVSDRIPPLSNGKRGHRRVETLEDIDVPAGIPPLPPGKRGHDRLETPSDSTPTRQPIGHKRIETLEDLDPYDSPPALKRIETLPDEPLDTPVLNGVERMRFDDIMTVPIPPALPSPIDPDDTPRASYTSDLDHNGNASRVEILSDASSPTTSPTPLKDQHAHAERIRRAKLSELSQRITLVTKSLASVQMLTASQAASAQATLPNSASTSKAEISHLRTTVDHLARLVLANAHSTLDAVNSHARTHS